MSMRRALALGFAVLPALAGLGCAPAVAPRYYINPQADMSLYKRVAVLPFSNVCGQLLAGERVTRAFVTELIISDRFRVIEPGEFGNALRDAGVTVAADGSFDPDKLKPVADKLGVSGVIRGAVTDYQVQRSRQDEFPVLSFDVEMLDVATGNVVWRASITRHGSPRVPVIGGAGSGTLGRLTQQSCVEIVDGLKRKAF